MAQGRIVPGRDTLVHTARYMADEYVFYHIMANEEERVRQEKLAAARKRVSARSLAQGMRQGQGQEAFG